MGIATLPRPDLAAHRLLCRHRSPKSLQNLSRIRLAYQIAKTLSEHDSPRVVQAWFTGLNPELQDCTPIRLLREEEVEKVGPKLLNAMRSFLAGG